MNDRFRLPVALLLILAYLLASMPATGQTVEEMAFELERDSTVQAELWTVRVPENRSDADSRHLDLRFLRLESRAERPGDPVVYLAGGPGGSGIRAGKGERWDLFERIREHADVILLDQRGTGRSDDVPRCESSVRIPPDSATTRERMLRLHRAALAECRAFWNEQGVDLRGYTTAESAVDVEAVRRALGAERVDLLGISYGTHLALAVAKAYPESVGRMVLASAEGLNDTVKRPTRHDRFLSRLQSVIDADPTAREAYPDIRAMMRTVLDSVEANPPTLEVRQRRGPAFNRTLGRFEAQVITGYMMGDPGRAAYMLTVYRQAAKGDYSEFERLLQWFAEPEIQMNGMAVAMDMASGVSGKRLQKVTEEAEGAVIGDALNFPMPHLMGEISGLDLGSTFREPLRSEHPTLLVSGTLDGRTFPEAHAAIAQSLPKSVTLTIENAGHNLFFSHPEIVPRIAAFLAGEAVADDTLTAAPPQFVRKNDES
jgi:pimeloyl-ACP methyl ester carboxylesterase